MLIARLCTYILYVPIIICVHVARSCSLQWVWVARLQKTIGSNPSRLPTQYPFHSKITHGFHSEIWWTHIINMVVVGSHHYVYVKHTIILNNNRFLKGSLLSCYSNHIVFGGQPKIDATPLQSVGHITIQKVPTVGGGIYESPSELAYESTFVSTYIPTT